MEVEIKFRELKLRVEMLYSHPTFEEEELGISGQLDIESIKLEDSEIDIIDLLLNDEEIIKQLIYEQL